MDLERITCLRFKTTDSAGGLEAKAKGLFHVAVGGWKHQGLRVCL